MRAAEDVAEDAAKNIAAAGGPPEEAIAAARALLQEIAKLESGASPDRSASKTTNDQQRHQRADAKCSGRCGSSNGGGDNRRKQRCAACGAAEAETVKLKKCSQCQRVAYCSKECQVQDWKAGHKTVCGR